LAVQELTKRFLPLLLSLVLQALLLSASSSTKVRISISDFVSLDWSRAPGTYKEQVYIPALKSALTLYGETTDTSGFASNTVTITQGKSQDDSANNDMTATLRAWTPNLKVYNINLVNTRGSGSQALAVSAYADRQGYYGCQFKGFQDTILAQTGNQVYAKSYIEG
jgi:pectinesterase